MLSIILYKAMFLAASLMSLRQIVQKFRVREQFEQKECPFMHWRIGMVRKSEHKGHFKEV